MRPARRRLLLGGVALLATLGGCATVAPLPAGERSYREVATVGGRLSVRYPEDGKPRSVQGKFLWSQQPGSIAIELYSPLGQTLARILIRPGEATFEAGRGERRTAASADALTRATLGWPLPVEGLRYWLQGFVQADGQVRAAAAPDGPDSFRSDGWLIRVAGWQAAGDTAIPKRIDLSRDDARGGEIALRLVLDDWDAGH